MKLEIAFFLIGIALEKVFFFQQKKSINYFVTPLIQSYVVSYLEYRHIMSEKFCIQDFQLKPENWQVTRACLRYATQL